jgi:hypothetical protein
MRRGEAWALRDDRFARKARASIPTSALLAMCIRVPLLLAKWACRSKEYADVNRRDWNGFR